jgi:adenosine deaminase
VETYGLTYADLKQIVRTSIEHSFLAGPSLWRDTDHFDRPVAACAQDSGATKRSAACAAFLQSSERAQQQWELERRFRTFEASH